MRGEDATGAVPRLERDVIQAWVVPLPQGAGDPGQAEAELSLLDAREREVASRFVHPRDRVRYILSHAAVRRILAAHLGRLPSELRVGRSDAGKPRLDGPDGADVRFNLSHAAGLAIVAISLNRDVGVDVEAASGVAWDEAFAGRSVGPPLAARLAALPADQRVIEFLRIWTSCEAVLKARGTGLQTLPFPADVLEPGNMQVVRFVPDSDHVAAVAGEGKWRLHVLHG